MKKDKISKEEKEVTKDKIEEKETCCGGNCDCNCSEQANTNDVQPEIIAMVAELTTKLEEKARQCDEYMNLTQRTAAEFDNFKKRTQKEKEALSLDSAIDTVNAFLPVVDNLERALKAAESMESNPLKDGVEMVMRQLKECLEKMGVQPIDTVGSQFNPDLHNAVMHVTDDEKEDNVIIEEFQKGYTMKDKVVRYSMVKVAN